MRFFLAGGDGGAELLRREGLITPPQGLNYSAGGLITPDCQQLQEAFCPQDGRSAATKVFSDFYPPSFSNNNFRSSSLQAAGVIPSSGSNYEALLNIYY